MSNIIEKFNSGYLKERPDFGPGDDLVVSQRIKEGDKERVQNVKGVVIGRKHGHEIGATFTIRKISDGIGVEMTFPLHSPNIEKIEVVRKGKVRRAKLFYLRSARGKKLKIKEKKQRS